MAFAFLKNLIAGTNENVSDVMTDLNQIKDELNGATATSTMTIAGDVTGSSAASLLSKITGTSTRFGTGAALTSNVSSLAQMTANYNPTTDRLIDSTLVGWKLYLDASSSDHLVVQRAPATAGAPSWATIAAIDAAGTLSGNSGKTNIATTESRTNTAYGTLTTPDQVSVVLPTDGLIEVAYQATWQESVSTAARAAIFVGATQLKRAPASGGAVVVQESATAGSPGGTDEVLTTWAGGVLGQTTGTDGAHSGDVTTGQVVGNSAGAGPCRIFAAAGTYVVSVQFKSSSGSVTVKNRRLWVKALAY